MFEDFFHASSPSVRLWQFVNADELTPLGKVNPMRTQAQVLLDETARGLVYAEFRYFNNGNERDVLVRAAADTPDDPLHSVWMGWDTTRINETAQIQPEAMFRTTLRGPRRKAIQTLVWLEESACRGALHSFPR